MTPDNIFIVLLVFVVGVMLGVPLGYHARGWEWPTQRECRERVFRETIQENQSLKRALTRRLDAGFDLAMKGTKQ